MIDRDHELPLVRQAELLRLSRGSLYYHPRVVPAGDLAIMRRIDELHLDYPFAGSRMLRDLLRGEGVAIGRERVASMMRRIGIEALYRRPHTSKPADGHKIYPYLLRDLVVERANQVWAMDITYIPNGTRLCLPGLPWWTGSVGGFSPGGSPSRWRSSSASTRLKRRWPGTARRRSSTPTVRMTASVGSDDPSWQSDEWPGYRRGQPAGCPWSPRPEHRSTVLCVFPWICRAAETSGQRGLDLT